MMKLKYFLLSILTVLCASSCAPLIFFGAGTAAGVVGFKYYQGALTVVYQAPYEKTWDAALAALEGMNLKIQSHEHDQTVGRIKALRADDTEIIVFVEYQSSNETEVVIRVGIFGDEGASVRIKEEIRRVLFKE